MKMNRIVISFVAAAALLTLAGCGSSTEAATEAVSELAATAATELSAEGYTVTEEMLEATEGLTAPPLTIVEGHNPAEDYAGAYSDEEGKPYSLFLEPTDEEDDVKVMIGHMDDEGNYYSYEFYGQIRDNVITYTDGACNKITPQEQTAVYEDGSGTLTISQNGSITWKDDKDNAGEGVVFVWDQALLDSLQERVDSAQQ